MKLADESIENYCVAHSSAPSSLCNEVERFTRDTREDAQMVIGPLEGSVLKWIIHSLGAKRILEIGTYTGYSALAMAEQLPENGEVVTLDIDHETNATAKKFWKQSPHGKKIRPILGAAAESMRLLSGEFDLVFIDADKEGYIAYFDEALRLLGHKGVVIVDNCLYYGTVLEPAPEDENARAIKRFNEYIKSRTDLIATLLPIRDGIYLIAKR